MSDEIEAFLRRAAARRQQRQGGQQQRPAAPPPRTLVPEIQIIEPAAEAEIVEAQPVRERTVGGQHLDTGDFAERASHMGERVGQADDKMEAHLQQVFDHKVGRLASSRKSDLQPQPATTATPTPGTASSDIAAMLRSPQSIRQAIILSEILAPPESRW